MDVNIENAAWDALSHAEKNHRLFLRQRETLRLFLERGAISQAQHNESLHALAVKMGEEEDDTWRMSI